MPVRVDSGTLSRMPDSVDAAVARKGKIARLPESTRAELNRRLDDGQRGPTILPWLNGLPEVTAILQSEYDGIPISDENLSQWRKGGYTDHRRRMDRIQRTAELAAYSRRMAEAGGGIMDLPASIAGGQIMEVLEEFDPSVVKTMLAASPELWLELLDKLARLQRSKADAKTVEQNDVRLAQADRKLSLEESKFQRQTGELFLKFYADQRAREIAESKTEHDVKVADLVTLMFGARPERFQ